MDSTLIEAEVIDELRPAENEIVIPKTSSSLFNSTNFEYVLRNLGVRQLVRTLGLFAAFGIGASLLEDLATACSNAFVLATSVGAQH